jgi:hypothetical protein
LDKPYDLNPSPKMIDLAEKCSAAMKEEGKTGSWILFDKYVESVIYECMDQIRKKYDATFPALRIKRCNTKEFEELKLRHGVTGSKTRGFYIPALKIIAVNLQASMEHDYLNFVTNMVIDYTEELLHSAFP